MTQNIKQSEPSVPLALTSNLFNTQRYQLKRSDSTENTTLLQSKMKFSITSCKTVINSRNLLVDIYAILFGIGSWIGVNGTYLQLPLFVATAPEGWNLPSFLVVIIQLGNLGPIIYTTIQKIFPNRVSDSYMIYCVLTIGTVAAIFTSFFYNKTMYVFGAERSLPLFICAFFFALVGCTSSVLFMPYMGRFRQIYLITYLVGEGLSGFLPSIVALIQGVGGNAECILKNTTEGVKYEQYSSPARFGSSGFYIFIFIMFICSTIAFTLLDQLKMSKNEHAAVEIKHGNNYNYDTDKNGVADEKTKKISPKAHMYLLISMGLVCTFSNGVFPSIQSYSCLPYGNLAYHLMVTLSSIANPIACFLAVFLHHTSIKLLSLLGFLAIIIAMYTMATALLSPAPPLVGTIFGGILVVVTWIILVGLISYIKLVITSILRFQGGNSLVWVGYVSQMGSFTGSVITFGLVNYTKLFVSYDPCAM